MKKDFDFWSNHFKNSSQRIESLVEAFTYIDEIAKLAQIYPDYWSLFKKTPRHWYVAYSSPYNGSTFRLNEPHYQEKAIETMKRHDKASLWPTYYLLLLFLRLIWFDWFVNRISDIKYQIQISWWWSTVRDWRVTQILNSLWTFPKRFLFDNTMDDKLESRLHLHSKHFTKHKIKKG